MSVNTKVDLDKYFKDKDIISHLGNSCLPTYLYSLKFLKDRCKLLHSVKFKNGFKVRYAIKANSNKKIIGFLSHQNIFFDASSIYEVIFLINDCGISPEKISLSSQEPVFNIAKNLNKNVFYNACSLHQLESYCKEMNVESLGLRINPGIGSGGNKRTTTGGVASSFGIWHEYLGTALEIAKKYKKKITKLHIHVGSGADPKVWAKVMDISLSILARMPDVTCLDIGGGFKIHRYADEEETDIKKVLEIFKDKLEKFEIRNGRKISLEIEPGTYMVGHAGVLVTKIVDIVDTGKKGFNFIKINAGMNDILRPSLYGAQHKIKIINKNKNKEKYVVVGHNCESGDIITTKKGNPEVLEPRILNKAMIGDVLVIYDAGAYCFSMSTKKYNQFPDAQELII